MQLTWQQATGNDATHLTEFEDSLGKVVLVNQQIVEDLQKLLFEAKQDGIEIAIVSAFRDFAKQLSIWNDKWQGYRPVLSRHGRPLNITKMSDIERYKAISLWSAMPGLSRHHWGTDLDIFDAEAIRSGYQVELVPSEFNPNGPCAKLNTWMQNNLEELGFFRPYKEYRNGVSVEPWHISHIQTTSQIMHQFDLEACKESINQSEIKAKSFIIDNLEHYHQQYFCNICEVT